MNTSVINRIRKVKGGKYELQLSQIVDNPKARTNVAALLNASDERFKAGTPKARLAWMSVEASDLKAALGIDVASLKFNKEGVAECEFHNPSIGGEQLCIRLVDSLTPNYNKKPKMSIKGEGDEAIRTVFTYKGKPIYQTTQIVGEKGLSHSIIERDGTMTGDEFDAYLETVGAQADTVDLSAE